MRAEAAAVGLWISGLIFLFAAILSNADMTRFLVYMGLSVAANVAAWIATRRATRALLAEMDR